jgi:hypothetical protein
MEVLMKIILLALVVIVFTPLISQATNVYCQIDSCYDQSDSVWSDSCYILLGDVNGDGVTSGQDVTYLNSFFHGGAAPIPDIRCDIPSYPPPYYMSADVNGSCNVSGSDLVYLVNYFKGIGPAPVCCTNHSGCKAYYP